MVVLEGKFLSRFGLDSLGKGLWLCGVWKFMLEHYVGNRE